MLEGLVFIDYFFSPSILHIRLATIQNNSAQFKLHPRLSGAYNFCTIDIDSSIFLLTLTHYHTFFLLIYLLLYKIVTFRSDNNTRPTWPSVEWKLLIYIYYFVQLQYRQWTICHIHFILFFFAFYYIRKKCLSSTIYTLCIMLVHVQYSNQPL